MGRFEKTSKFFKEMKAILLTLALAGAVLAIQSKAEDQSSAVNIERDPETITEFSKFVRDAARNGAVRVRFPSGEWNWYCTGQINLSKKESYGEWSSNDEDPKRDDLGKWLRENKIAAVQVSMSQDCDPVTFFKIEAFLRERNIVYWVQSPDASETQKKLIRLLETDGVARSLPMNERHIDK